MRPSKIDRLPPEIRDQIAALRAAGKTIDEIMVELRVLALPPGALPHRSGLGLYIQRLDRLDPMRASKPVARRHDSLFHRLFRGFRD